MSIVLLLTVLSQRRFQHSSARSSRRVWFCTALLFRHIHWIFCVCRREALGRNCLPRGYRLSDTGILCRFCVSFSARVRERALWAHTGRLRACSGLLWVFARPRASARLCALLQCCNECHNEYGDDTTISQWCSSYTSLIKRERFRLGKSRFKTALFVFCY